MSNYLEKSDYIPLINFKLNKCIKSIHNFVDSKFILVISVNDITDINENEIIFLNNIKELYHNIILYKNGIPNIKICNSCSNDNKMTNLFKFEDSNKCIYYINPNRRIFNIDSINDLTKIDLNLIKNYKTINHIPYLLIEDVLDDALLSEIVNYLKDNKENAHLHNTASKHRYHVHPKRDLEMRLDNKLSRSLFPEIKKIFYFDVNYRELYKFCSYDSDKNGRFHPHRDTPHPYQHRRYAMSLFLNDDYEGGEFELPEYNLKIKPKKNSAFVFPGICSHKVNTVTKGSRLTIITFYCSEIEGKTKDNSMYTVKSNFYKDKKVEFSKIYPI